VLADNITGADFDGGPEQAEAKFGTSSSGDDGLTHACELADGKTERASVSDDIGCDVEVGKSHLRVAGVGTGTVSGGDSPSPLASSGLGGVGGIMFVTGGCGISGSGGPSRAESMGGDGSSAGRCLLGRLEDGKGANQVRFLGITLVSASG
jgi:hypothetical protein